MENANLINKKKQQSDSTDKKNDPKRLKKFNVKGWIATWATLGAVGIVLLVGPTINYQVNTVPQLQDKQRNEQQTNVAKFFSNLNVNPSLKSQVQTLPSEVIKSFQNPIDLAKVNEILKDSGYQIPDLQTSGLSSAYQLQFSASADDGEGTITFHVNIVSNDQMFNQNGSATTQSDQAGKNIVLSGFNQFGVLIKHYYQSLQQLQLTVSAANQNVFANNTTLSNTPSLTDVNNILSSPLPALPEGLASNGYSVSFVKGTLNPVNGSLIVNIIVMKNDQKFDINGTPIQTAVGLPLNITGFKKIWSRYKKLLSSSFVC
ncbi:hypothetical protein [[Mycoplasma] testudinis]|uniref:hypothetical protein n=1 Tax=[Mycoplasma] testudinis TaxID=33924 RepID=UPI00048920E4|nr:hypothetical protein [[Mycoplasma] testudinis]